MGAAHLVYRTINFDRVVKRDFYYNAYMRYIKPDTLVMYQLFLQRLDEMCVDDLEKMLRDTKSIPYIHRQAALRKKREITDI